jgi:glycosyltransferase involved in cell wall biosynthesis
VGKLSPGKGFPVFVEAARLVASRMPEACFVVVGDGAGESPKAAGNIRFLGRRTHAEVETLYTLADMVVHPAVWPEPFSRVVLEATTYACALIGTRIGGTPEAIEDRMTGLLIERKDPQALAKAIEELLTDRSLRERLGRRAAEEIPKKFSPDSIVGDLLRVYRGAIR